MKEGSTKLEVAREVVLEVHPKHRLALHAVVGIAFERHVDIGACVEQTLVDDGYDPTAVVDGVVHTFGKRHTVGGNDYRTFGHVIGAERNFARLRSAVLTSKDELILFGNLLGYGLGRVVEFLEHILIGKGIIANHLAQVAAEGFYDGEEDAARGGIDCITFHEVEVGIRILAVVVVQAVETEEL